MSFLYLSVLAVSLSADSFAASVGQGAVAHDLPVQRGLATAGLFALFQAAMPALGWQIADWSHLAAGAGDRFAAVDHWLVFGLLTVVAVLMLRSGGPDALPKPGLRRASLVLLVMTAFATSLDSLGAGLGLGLLETPLPALVAVVGAVTFAMSLAGFTVGRLTGRLSWFPAHILAGLVVFAVGLGVLADHGTFAGILAAG